VIFAYPGENGFRSLENFEEQLRFYEKRIKKLNGVLNKEKAAG